ncbi:Rqc2 family fibronectin-binding protein [Mycoplasma sp. P36-A1]|uniref:Rqc2 family fibronectin-binding protein n=1 Tax=Mycoplasma sp. P36-A1 TaxID=3252900 RepID=UPI003C2F9009
MIDGLLTTILVKDLKEKILTGKIQKIYQLNDFELLFKIRANRKSYQLINSIQSNTFRLHLSENNYQTLDTPTNFTMVLRKQLEGGIISDIKQTEADRSIIFEITKLNELRDEQKRYLIFELVGRHSNTILTDENFKIIHTLRFVPLSMGTVRIMHKGAYYEPLVSDKKNPLKSIENSSDYTKEYQGFSSMINKEFLHLNTQGYDASSILKEYLDSNKVYVYDDIISMIPLNYTSKEYKQFNDINAAFDYQYSKESSEKSINQIFKKEIKTIKSTIKKNSRKIDKLSNDLIVNQNNDNLKYEATLIFNNIYLYDKNKRYDQIDVFDYDLNKSITIVLDSKYTLIENASRIMNKYNKAKNSLSFIQEQIDQATIINDVLSNSLENLEYANINDTSEIIDELVSKKYIHIKNHKISKKKKKAPMYETYITPDNTTLFVGKNNIQNDYITFKLASRFDTWTHVKGIPGSHVIIHSENVTSNDLEWGARLALYYSKASKDIKYDVDYTLVKNLKKLKGAKLGMVTFNTNETITIDNNYELILQLKRG